MQHFGEMSHLLENERTPQRGEIKSAIVTLIRLPITILSLSDFYDQRQRVSTINSQAFIFPYFSVC